MKDAKYGQRGRPWERFTDGTKKDMQRVEGKEDRDMVIWRQVWRRRSQNSTSLQHYKPLENKKKWCNSGKGKDENLTIFTILNWLH